MGITPSQRNKIVELVSAEAEYGESQFFALAELYLRTLKRLYRQRDKDTPYYRYLVAKAAIINRHMRKLAYRVADDHYVDASCMKYDEYLARKVSE